eukprot:CCRYP_001950-RA/>CCRYP_001950-RA protein AED:0.04 eAED:0.04 QI:282/1/1/1/1/1/3/206/503
MCQRTLPSAIASDVRASSCQPPNKVAHMKILLCSENVPPQVNGIARRIGMYAEGLEKLGCEVELLHPGSGISSVLSHINPWNFTASMMLIHPLCLYRLLTTSYDVIHLVMPANLSGMWILAMFKVVRCLRRESKPTLVVSWHCNIVDYIQHFSIGPLRYLAYFFFYLLFGMLPLISDRVLTPTKKSEPQLVRMWKRSNGKACSGVCFTGVNKSEFCPKSLESTWGKTWLAAKEKFLSQEKKKYLIVCVGRLSPEKGVEELIRTMPMLKECALWLVGDGPFRPELERICRNLNVPVKFLGYQSGDALHSVYAVGDMFVCPSLTETFGQTVNEALASQVRVALPNVPVFAEAYGEVIPKDAFWKPLDRNDMARAISKQLERHAARESCSLPDLNKLKSWEDASQSLLEEYNQASRDRQHTFTFFAALYFPMWWIVTISTVISFYLFSIIRTWCGGSVRLFFKTAAEDAIIKVQSLHRLPSFPSFNSLQQSDSTEKKKQLKKCRSE